MADKITHALTPEEWRRYRRGNFSDRREQFADLVQRENLRGAAAAALYREESGFTREDVEMLRAAARDAALIDDDDARPFAELADRIEALLPREHG